MATIVIVDGFDFHSANDFIIERRVRTKFTLTLNPRWIQHQRCITRIGAQLTTDWCADKWPKHDWRVVDQSGAVLYEVTTHD